MSQAEPSEPDEQFARLETPITDLRYPQRVLETQCVHFGNAAMPANIRFEFKDIDYELRRHIPESHRLHFGALTFQGTDVGCFDRSDTLAADLIDRIFLAVLGASRSVANLQRRQVDRPHALHVSILLNERRSRAAYP